VETHPGHFHQIRQYGNKSELTDGSTERWWGPEFLGSKHDAERVSLYRLVSSSGISSDVNTVVPENSDHVTRDPFVAEAVTGYSFSHTQIGYHVFL
jgi:hypothetical protein